MESGFITLHTGAKMPIIGLGTFLSPNEHELFNAVKKAVLENGYR